MLTSTEIQTFLDNKLPLIKVIFRTKQWSGICESDFHKWLNINFRGDLQGKYFVVKILLNSIFYSERNIIKLLQYGIFDKIFSEEIRNKFIEEGDIYKIPTKIFSLVNEIKDRTLFIPLLDKNSPNESGNQIVRTLTHKLNISQSHTVFHFAIHRDILSQINKIVFVDDCIGSGQQLLDFWNKIKDLRDYACSNNIKLFYLILTGYKNNIENIKSNTMFSSLEIVTCDNLLDEDRVFSDKNPLWEGDERAIALDYFTKLQKEKGIPMYGYGNLDFAVFLHNTVPDWTLPIFWKEDANWKALIKRKSSSN